ncbi:MAG: hypothetical protein ABI120_26235 [Gemmatimonadaceae bacterium]
MLSQTVNRRQRCSIAAVLTLVAATSLCGSANSLHAQGAPLTPAAKFVDSARVEIDAAALADDAPRLERAVVLLDRALTAFPKDVYLLHYRGYANYRRVVHLFRANDMQQAGPLIASAIADLQASSDKLHWAESFALLSGLQGFRIALDPSLGQELGMEIGALSGEAARYGPNNPRVLLMAAYSMQNMPPEYGGGLDKARALAERAIAAFASDTPGPLAPTWGKAEAQALLKTLSGGSH